MRPQFNNPPLVSIITTVRNDKHRLKRVLEQVARQTYPFKEHLVIDGGSTDGTLGVLREHNARVDFWISELDSGIYDAMNKGITAAKGEWVYFLGVDDIFYDAETLDFVFRNRYIPQEVVLIIGDVRCAGGRLFTGRFGKGLWIKNTIHHQGAFYRREIFRRFRYGQGSAADTVRHYRISGDYQLNLMLWQSGVKHLYLRRTIAECEDGISMQARLEGYLEEIRIRHQALGYGRSIFFDFITIMRYLFKRVRRPAGR